MACICALRMLVILPVYSSAVVVSRTFPNKYDLVTCDCTAYSQSIALQQCLAKHAMPNNSLQRWQITDIMQKTGFQTNNSAGNLLTMRYMD